MDLTPALAGLSDKKRLYVQARLTGMNTGAAARAAGMKVPENSWRMYEFATDVQLALQKGREISMQATGIDRKKVSDMLLAAYDAATNTVEMVAAARELGKLHGLYEAQKLEVNHRLEQVKTERELRTLSTADLEQLVAKGPDDFLETEYVEVPMLEHAVVRPADDA